MNENRKTHGWAWVFLLLVVLLAYPLSSGPAVALYGASGRNETVEGILVKVYGPLDGRLLPRPIYDALEWWWNLWDVYGVRDDDDDEDKLR